MSDLTTSWKVIETWLAQHAPEAFESLREGASEAEVRAAEERLGVTFPSDVRASYLLHDGQWAGPGFLNGGREFLSLERIVDEWGVWKDLLEAGEFAGVTSQPDAFIRNDWWHPAWIPLTHDGSGNHDCLDLAPAVGGTVGQIIDFWHDSADRTRVATSFGAWLATLAEEMLGGRLVWSEDYGAVVRKEDA